MYDLVRTHRKREPTTHIQKGLAVLWVGRERVSNWSFTFAPSSVCQAPLKKLNTTELMAALGTVQTTGGKPLSVLESILASPLTSETYVHHSVAQYSAFATVEVPNDHDAFPPPAADLHSGLLTDRSLGRQFFQNFRALRAQANF